MSAAPSWDSSCSIVRGPMIGDVTAGCASTKPSAMSIMEMPASSASWASCSTASSLVWFSAVVRSKRSGTRSARCDFAGSWPLRYRPVSQPPASGLHGITAMPNFSHAGSTSASMARARIEYGGCSQTNRSRLRRSETHCASTISGAGYVE